MNKRVCVVAHPDDEILWAAGLMLRHPGDWTIISCTIPNLDPIRAWCFYEACEVIGARGKLFPKLENQPLVPELNYGHLRLEEFDHILTHGHAGEYGHMDHIVVHNAMVNMWSHKPLTFFGYKTGEHILKLSAKEIKLKEAALEKYDYIRTMYPTQQTMKQYESLRSSMKRTGVDLNVETFDGVWPL